MYKLSSSRIFPPEILVPKIFALIDIYSPKISSPGIGTLGHKLPKSLYFSHRFSHGVGQLVMELNLNEVSRIDQSSETL